MIGRNNVGTYYRVLPIKGYCPMGCGQTLFLGPGDKITCSSDACPRPTAVDEILADRAEHIVAVRKYNFTVRHPLRERLDNSLMHCRLDDFMEELPNDEWGSMLGGTFIATHTQDQWSFKEMKE